MQITSPMRLRAALKIEQHRALIASQDTQMLPVVRSESTDPMLPIDVQGRQYLLSHNPYEPTLLLVSALVREFRRKTGSYPTEICLCYCRYDEDCFGQAWQHYYLSGSARIPYRRAANASYEVMVRGHA